MNAHRTGTPMLASSGYISQVDEALCIGCEDCADYCQFSALEMGDLVMEVNYEKCMGCGVCVDKCEQGAIALVRDESKGIPLEICALMDEAVISNLGI
jgi:heterodisulfide reductase subunit A-like polyferredoxin